MLVGSAIGSAEIQTCCEIEMYMYLNPVGAKNWHR